jgi:hypothetical protein
LKLEVLPCDKYFVEQYLDAIAEKTEGSGDMILSQPGIGLTKEHRDDLDAGLPSSDIGMLFYLILYKYKY